MPNHTDDLRRVSGETEITRRIMASDADEAVRRCLQALFMHELETAEQLNPNYTAQYERAITRFAPAWDRDSSTAPSGDAE